MEKVLLNDLEQLYINMAIMENVIINESQNLNTANIANFLDYPKKQIDAFVKTYNTLNWKLIKTWDLDMHTYSLVYLYYMDDIIQQSLNDLDLFYKDKPKPMFRNITRRY